jgi:hypothetical protein
MTIEWQIKEKDFNSTGQLTKIGFKVSLGDFIRDREYMFTSNNSFDNNSTDEEIISFVKNNLGLGQKQALEDGLTQQAA